MEDADGRRRWGCPLLPVLSVAWPALVAAACGAPAPTRVPPVATADTSADVAVADLSAGGDADAWAPDAANLDGNGDPGEVGDSGADATSDFAADTATDATAASDGGCFQAPTCIDATTVGACKGGVWTAQPCGPLQICVAGACKVQICAPGAAGCAGGKVATCDATGTVQTSGADCAAAGKVCDQGQCKAKVCEPGAKHCDGEAAAVCSAAGTAWLVAGDCLAAGAVCVGGTCVPLPCADGGKGCYQGAVVSCTGKTWQAIEDCKPTGKACDQGACKATLCAPGEFDCVGGLVIACESAGLAWSLPLSCPKGTACQPGIGCLPLGSVCQPDDTGCQGSQPVACDAAGTASPTGDDCAKSGLVCAGGSCHAKVCAKGAIGCQGNTAVACTDGGDAWLPLQDCGNGVCSGGTCGPKLCGLGQVACGAKGLAVCAGAWAWSACPAGEVCSAGQCTAPQCAIPALKGPLLATPALTIAPVPKACDLDGDKKPDAALAAIAQFSQAGASAQLALGVLRAIAFDSWPAPTALTVLPVGLAGAATACTAAACPIAPIADGYDVFAPAPTCPAKSVLVGATWSAATGAFSAGGAASSAVVPVQVGALAIEVPLLGARLVGVLGEKGGTPEAFDGVLCGAIPASAFALALGAVPDAAFAGGAADKAKLVSLFTQLAAPDLDSDGDGVKDAISAAFAIALVPAQPAPPP